MGMVSMLEDISDRFEESDFGATSIGAPAGGPSLPIPKAIPPKSSRPVRIEMSASHRDLFGRCLTFKTDVDKAFSQQERHDLARQLDSAKEQYRILGLKNVLASQATKTRQAEEFLCSVRPLVEKVNEAVHLLESRIAHIDSLLTALEKPRSAVQSPPNPSERKVEEDAVWLLQTWEQLREEADAFRDELDGFEVGISGELFEDMIRNDSRAPEQKD